jgi:hypothetical protein
MGPLSVHPTNTRYFADQNGSPVYLTGSHTWLNFQNFSQFSDFDYSAYLDFLEDREHNFFRLWVWEHSRSWDTDPTPWVSPLPYERTGPGTANDGLSRFDLTQFNQGYFDRLRTRVIQAQSRGIYVSIMLFNGWSVDSGKGAFVWTNHPLNEDNNIDGIDGDLNNDGNGVEAHELAVSAVTAIQEDYVRKVIDTVNDFYTKSATKVILPRKIGNTT